MSGHITIPDLASRIAYTGDGVLTVFPIPFPFFATGDVVVEVNDVVVGSGITITGTAVDGGYTSGNVTFTAAPAAGTDVTVYRDLAIARTSDFIYPSRTLDIGALNTDLDRLTAVQQDWRRETRRSFRVPASEGEPVLVPPLATRRNRYAGWDSNGNLIAQDVTAVGASAARGWVDASSTPYLADPTGVADSTTAINNALATGRPVYLPRGNYATTAPLILAISGQSLFGDGEGQTIITPTGSFHVIRCNGPAEHVSVRDLTIEAAGMTGGYCLYTFGADRVMWERIRINDPWHVAYVFQTNDYTARDIYVQNPRGTVGWWLEGTLADRSDVVRLVDVNIGGTAYNWTGLTINGFINTTQVDRVTFVGCLRGVDAKNVSGSFDGMFLVATDLEVDFCAQECMRLNDFDGVWLTNLYLQGSGYTGADAPCLSIGAAVDSVKIANAYIRGARAEGIYCAGQDVCIVNSQVIFNSYPDYFEFDAVRVLGTAKRVQFIGCAIGADRDIGATVRYGANVEAGAESVRFIGCDFYGCARDPVMDSSGSTLAGNVEVVGCGSADQFLNERVSGFEYGVKDGGGALVTPTVDGGVITAIAVSAGGGEYTVVPLVAALDPLGLGSGFTGTPVLTAGAVSSVTINTGGTAYSAGTILVVRSGARNPTLKARYPGQANISARFEADGTGVVEMGNDTGTGLSVTTVGTGQNFIQARGQPSGTAGDLIAAGADTNIDFAIYPKGTGYLKVGTFTAAADAPTTGYIEIKDAAGNVRKLATIA